jgi:hypothetical protein
VRSIRFTGRYRIYFPGDVASFPAAEAAAIVASGAAVFATEESVEKKAVPPRDEQATATRVTRNRP